MAKNPETISAIDLGTHRTCCVIAELGRPDQIEVIGIGTRRTEGIRRGVIVNLEALVGSIRGAIADAEQMAGRRVEAALATVPAAQARSFTSRGAVAVAARDRVVSRKDLDKVLETVRAVQIPTGQLILHTLPQEYTLDGQEGIQDPVGMHGARIEASVHVVTVPQQAAQHVVTALNHAQVEVVTLCFPLLAAAESVLSAEEKEQGVFLIDIGGGTTDVALFDRGALWFTGSIPIAGELITNDISIGLRTPVQEAEKIKRNNARAVAEPDDDEVSIEVPTVGGGQPRVVTSTLLTQIVAPRVSEIFEQVRGAIDRFGLGGRARAGAVIVGGSANLDGLLEIAKDVLGMEVRAGVPTGVGGLVEDIRVPSFATPVGLIEWELRHGRRQRLEARRGERSGVVGGFLDKIRKTGAWIGQMF